MSSRDRETRDFPWVVLMVIVALVAGGFFFYRHRMEMDRRGSESRPIGVLRTVSVAQKVFRDRALKKKVIDGKDVSLYGDWNELAKADLIDPDLARTKEAHQYQYELKLVDGGRKFQIVARPVKDNPFDHRLFYTDETGKITFSTSGTPDGNSSEIE